MYSDGTSTFVRVTDPWDRQVGTPGAPGPYADDACDRQPLHPALGRLRQGVRSRGHGLQRVNLQILHADSTRRTTPPTTAPPPAPAMRRRARDGRAVRRVSCGESFSINWDEVEQIAQPTDVSCWATAGAMVVGWRDQMSLTRRKRSPRSARPHHGDRPRSGAGRRIRDELGLVAEPPSATPSRLPHAPRDERSALGRRSGAGPHAIVVTGLYGDGNEHVCPGHRSRGIATSARRARPAPYATTHATGSRYIMTLGRLRRGVRGAPRPTITASTCRFSTPAAQPAAPRTTARRRAPGYAQSLRWPHALRRPEPGDGDRTASARTARATRRSLTQPGGRRRRPAAPARSAGCSINTTACAGRQAPGRRRRSRSVDRQSRLDDWPLCRLARGRRAAADHGVLATPGRRGRRRRDSRRRTRARRRRLDAGRRPPTSRTAPDRRSGRVARRLAPRRSRSAGQARLMARAAISFLGDGTYQRRDRWEQAAA